MKTKILSFLLLVIMTVTLFSGCSSKYAFTVELTKGDSVILTASENAEQKLKEVKISDGTSLFKNVVVSENNGLFYNSYTFKATTNTNSATEKYKLSVSMPGNIIQSKGGTAIGNTIEFEIANMKAENDFAAYSDSNNITAVIVIISLFTLVAAGFIFIIKRKQG